MEESCLGTIQFFGVNHMSEEKARAQSIKFQDVGAIVDVLDAAYDEGIRVFMCTTHEPHQRHMRSRAEQSGALREFSILPLHAVCL